MAKGNRVTRGRQIGNEVGWEYLDEQQRKFALLWVKYHDMKRAMTEAGYAVDTHYSNNGRRMLKRCRRYVDHLEEMALREASISVVAIQHELAKMAFANPLDFYVDDVTVDGKKWRRPKKLDELTRSQAAAVKEWTYTLWKDPNGDEHLVLGEIKLHDKRASLVDLGKTMGLFQDKPPPAAGDERAPIDLSRLSSTQLKSLEGILRSAADTVSSARDQAAIPVSSPGAVTGQQLGPASPQPVPLSPPARGS